MVASFDRFVNVLSRIAPGFLPGRVASIIFLAAYAPVQRAIINI
jgi:hypothetical protein